VLVASLDDVDAQALRSAMDVIRKKRPDTPILLAGVKGGKVAVNAFVPKPCIEKGLKAGDWVKAVAQVVGGGGGGKPDQAQAGGKDPSKLNEALDTARAFASEKTS
jgi:alanyl-tRNA synthetase